MNVSKKAVVGIAGTLTLAAAAAVGIAQNPGVNTSPFRHPNLNAAQRLIEQAMGRIDAAQSANEFDMNGHAAHAKQLLDQADAEIKAAAATANRR